MFVEFLYELRARGVKVGAQEAMGLARALALELHGSKLDGFYEVARALCVHREQDLDAFDRAFAFHFRGVPDDALKLTEEMLQWLQQAAPRRELTPEEQELLEALDVEELKKRLQQRIAEQKERHDRGNQWVGTGGTSPFGREGQNPQGARFGEGARGGRGAIRQAEERRFKDLRGDVTLDTRQIEVALRRLRATVRVGAQDELDLEGTIDATAKNAGELEVKLRAPRRSDLKVLLLLDVGGSMDPYAEACERLFSAAKRATHFKKLKTLYFHNCVYGRLYEDAQLWKGPTVQELARECDPTWRLIVVGDALMHPWELQASGGRWEGTGSSAPGYAWLIYLMQHFSHSAWLNPEPRAAWTGTAEMIGQIFPMFRLSLDGLGEAVQHLMRGGTKR